MELINELKRLHPSRKLTEIMGIRPIFLILPVLFSFASAVFDGVSIYLLVPTLKGILQMDFAFIGSMPFFKTVIAAFPGTFHGAGDSNKAIFILLLGTILVSSMLKSGLAYLSTIIVNYHVRRFGKSIREQIFSRYLSSGKAFFDVTSKGRLQTILLYFPDEIAWLLQFFNILINDIFTIAVYMTFMSFISWKLTILSFILVPVFYFVMERLVDKIKAVSAMHADSRVMMSWRVNDILSCMTLIRTCSKQKEEFENFQRLSDAVADTEFSIDRKLALITPAQEIVFNIILITIISAMAIMFIKEPVAAISNYLVFFYLLRKAAPHLNGLSKFKGELARNRGKIKGVIDVLENYKKFIVKSGNVPFEKLKEKIEFRGLTFRYNDGPVVLDNVSFTVERGQFTAIVGPTGSGKTTIISLLLRLYECPAGTILIDGKDIREYDVDTLYRNISFVSQDTLLFNDTVRNNIAYGRHGAVKEEEILDAAKKAKLHDFIITLPKGYDTLIGDRGVRLSGGERQRLSIARALIKGAGILILDEATSALDTKTERLIQDAIDYAIKDKTAIVIAHRLSTVKHSDKIITIENGKVGEQGPMNELIDRKGKFYQYWEEQRFIRA